jgi:hypothetical protein
LPTNPLYGISLGAEGGVHKETQPVEKVYCRAL